MLFQSHLELLNQNVNTIVKRFYPKIRHRMTKLKGEGRVKNPSSNEGTYDKVSDETHWVPHPETLGM